MKCISLVEYDQIIEFLDKVIKDEPKKIAFDYESNAKRPYTKGTKLLTISNQLPSLLTGSGNLKTAILEEIPAGTKLIGSVKQAGSTKTILKEEIDLNTSGDHTLISAPGSGAIKIVNIVLSNNDSSADQVVIFKSGSTSINGAGFTLAPKAFIQFNGSPGEVFWELDATTALHIDISSSTQLSGIVTYYID